MEYNNNNATKNSREIQDTEHTTDISVSKALIQYYSITPNEWNLDAQIGSITFIFVGQCEMDMRAFDTLIMSARGMQLKVRSVKWLNKSVKRAVR